MLYFALLTTKDLPIIRVMYLIKTILSIAFIVVPIILIVVASFELFKVMTKPDETNKSISKIINKMISAVIIFFIPIGVNFIMNMLSQNTLDKIEYWTSADNKTIKQLTKLKEKEATLNKRIKNQKKVEEYQKKSVALIEDLQALKDYRGDKLSDEEKAEIDKLITENKEAVKNKLSDNKRNEALELINELKSYSIPNTEYSLNELEYIIQNGNEGQNLDLVYKYLDDINSSLIELDVTNIEAELAYDKLEKSLDISSANIDTIEASIREITNKIANIQSDIRKENQLAQNSSGDSGGTVYAASSSQRDQIVSFALQHVGITPYVYGGTSLTTGADCSGFVQAVYAHFGISIPRTAATQAQGGRKVALSDVRPGDLIFSRNYGHVTMYIGNNQVVQSQCTACGPVKVTNIPSNAHDAVSYIND